MGKNKDMFNNARFAMKLSDLAKIHRLALDSINNDDEWYENPYRICAVIDSVQNKFVDIERLKKYNKYVNDED